MAYTKQTWIDEDVTKPLSAARMNYIEEGIATAHAQVGPPGAPGDTLSIGTVQTGTTAGATITGTSPNKYLNLTLPGGLSVKPPLKTSGGTDPASGTVGATLLDILRKNAKYNLVTWWAGQFASQASTGYLSLGGNGEHQIRPVASAALGVAALLHTGTWSDSVSGVTQAVARERAVRWATSLAHAHRATTSGGWGRGWQSALWASLAGQAAWLLWDDLSQVDRDKVMAMVVDEANNPYWTVPQFWKGPDGTERFVGDSKAEELAWVQMIWALAVAMMPGHPNANVWQRQENAFLVSAWSTPSDIGNPTVADGYAISESIDGWNVNPDGTVINHNLVHPDYMAAASLSLTSGYVAALAGQYAPVAATHNVARVWAAFTERNFLTADGFAAPGGTIYVSGSANLYYPQGNDWSDPGLSTRVMDKASFDVMVASAGLDRGVSVGASTWAQRHLGAVQTLQARSTTGQVYQAEGEDKYQTREQWISMNAAIAWLFKWAVDRGLYKHANGKATPSLVSRSTSGVATLAAPATSVKTTGAISYGDRFFGTPTVFANTPINASGQITQVYPVSLLERTFQIRYLGSAAMSDVTAAWSVTGNAFP